MAEPRRIVYWLATMAALQVALLGVMASWAYAAESTGPAWRLSVISFPTDFAPGTTGGTEHGPSFDVTVRNVGSESTSGTVTIRDILPPGVSVAPGGPEGEDADVLNEGQIPCDVNAGVVTCSTAAAIDPGRGVRVKVPIDLPADGLDAISNEVLVEGGGASPATATTEAKVTTDPTPFGFVATPFGAFGTASTGDGSAATLAGSHPYMLTVGMNFAHNDAPLPGESLRSPSGGVRTINGELAHGSSLNPAALPRCKELDFEDQVCPVSTQVGVSRTTLALFGYPLYEYQPLYNLVPPPGYPASFGTVVQSTAFVHVLGRVRSNGDYGLSGDVREIPQTIGVIGAELTFWGNPSDQSHDWARGECLVVGVHFGDQCETERLDTALITLPSSCDEDGTQNLLKIESWEGLKTEHAYTTSDLAGNPESIGGCNSLAFEPSIEAKPTTNLGDSPSGLDFDLHQPQEMRYEGRSTANLKDTKVTLPAGLALNPSAGDGLEGCTPDQLGPDGTEPPQCPDASKIGSVEVQTPLLTEPLAGAVYLAKPFDNEFGSLIAIYIAVDDPKTGVVAKLPARVEADPVTGQLTTTVRESPELPLEDVRLHLFGGARGTLTTPATCGTHTTSSELTPWSAPEGQTVFPQDSFQTTASPAGDCHGNESQLPNVQRFLAGTVSPQAGAYSPFVLRLARNDGTQRITAVDTTLPEGLVGKLTGIPYCSEAQIAVAEARRDPEEGKLEQKSPSCPAASEVGTVVVGAGSGPNPLHVTGHAYLAGPYKGAPLSMAIVTPAVAGPFDLGVVVVRVALNVNLETTRIHAVSDPLPTILQGIPLDVRSIELKLDRPSFTLNPTSCEPMQIGGSATSALGQASSLSSSFQVGGCSSLGFKPKLSVSLKGSTKRTGLPALKAVVKMPAGGANIARAQVSLPQSEFLEQGNLDKVCTQPQLKAAACPAGSIYGRAKAWTPLLDQPLEGPVYLGVGYGHQLPDLVADLNGQIRILVHGKVDTTKQHSLRNTFEVVPDAPVSKFVLEMKGGKKYGLLANSENICRRVQRATATFTAHNGKTVRLRPKIANSCKSRLGKHKKHTH